MNLLKSSLVLVIAAAVQGEPQRLPMESQERQALLDLYKMTDGNHWKLKEGWGSSASPCEWYGVRCGMSIVAGEQRSVVEGLYLAGNNLRGTLPRSLLSLAHLTGLDVARNHLFGPISEELLERWDSQRLDFSGTGNSFSNFVVQARLTVTASSLLCAEDEDVRFIAEFDEGAGRAVFQSVRCRKGTRVTYCLVREGRAPSLDRLSRGLAALGFLKFGSMYDEPFTATHGVYMTTSAVWGNKSNKAVTSYNRQGPIQVWMVQQLFLGLVQDTQWERTFEKSKCEGIK